MIAENGIANVQYPRPLRSQEAADWLGISSRQLVKLAKEGVVKGKKVDGIWFFSQKELARFAGVVDD